jgi:hypothetical protein
MEKETRTMKTASLKFSTEQSPSFHDIRVDDEGNVLYYNEKGVLHRLDGPAVEKADGTKQWYVNGKLHRLDGPAIEYVNGTKMWYQNDKLHREDGPAIEFADGRKVWQQNNKLHRLDGPAVEGRDGAKQWWVNEKLVGSSEGGFTQEKFEQWKKEHGL